MIIFLIGWLVNLKSIISFLYRFCEIKKTADFSMKSFTDVALCNDLRGVTEGKQNFPEGGENIDDWLYFNFKMTIQKFLKSVVKILFFIQFFNNLKKTLKLNILVNFCCTAMKLLCYIS